MTDTTTTVSVKQSSGWFEWVRKYLPTLILIGGGIIFLTTFFNTGKVDHTDIANIKQRLDQIEKEKATNDAFKALQDQVNRQYSTQSVRDTKQDADIEVNADWIQREQGRQQGRQQAFDEIKNKR